MLHLRFEGDARPPCIILGVPLFFPDNLHCDNCAMGRESRFGSIFNDDGQTSSWPHDACGSCHFCISSSHTLLDFKNLVFGEKVGKSWADGIPTLCSQAAPEFVFATSVKMTTMIVTGSIVFARALCRQSLTLTLNLYLLPKT